MNKDVCYFSVCDTVAHMFGPMFPAINDGVAKRMFRKLLSEVDNLKEFDLYEVGVFNQETGEFASYSNFVCNGADLLEVDK